MRLSILSAVILLALTGAACGGGGSKSSTTTVASTTTSVASTPTSAGSDPAAVSKAQKLVFVQADLPPGWTATPSSNTPDDQALSNELDACIGTSGPAGRSADVNGDDFTMGQATQVSSQAQIVKSETTYRSDIAAIKGPKLQSCLQDFATKAISKAAGGPPASLQLTDISVPTFGDVTIGKRVTAAISVAGQSLNIYVDFVLMGKNKAEVTGSFTNAAQPFDQALETTLINKLGAKLNANA